MDYKLFSGPTREWLNTQLDVHIAFEANLHTDRLNSVLKKNGLDAFGFAPKIHLMGKAMNIFLRLVETSFHLNISLFR